MVGEENVMGVKAAVKDEKGNTKQSIDAATGKPLKQDEKKSDG